MHAHPFIFACLFSLYFPLVVCVYSPLNYPSSSLALLPCTYTYTLRFSHTVLHSSLWMCGGKKAFVFKDNYFFFFAGYCTAVQELCSGLKADWACSLSLWDKEGASVTAHLSPKHAA